MSARSGVLAAAAIVVLAVTVVFGAAPALAASKPKPVAPDQPMISFPLPHSPGHEFFPNAQNLADGNSKNGPLLLFLPATRAVPADYRSFLDTASDEGFHVLALDYWNRGKSVVRTCAGIPQCYAAVQRNRFDGSDPTAWSAIAPEDSILTRLRAALSYLRTSDPRGGWAKYATGNHIHWSTIVVAGHSQGGGQSAFIAHNHRVHGALMFSSPVQADNGVPATWMLRHGATPASRLFGFVNSHDMYYRNVVDSWKTMGMGEPVPAGPGLVFRTSNTVVSTRDVGTPGQSHLSTVFDSTPRNSHGVPIYESTWRWMLQQVR